MDPKDVEINWLRRRMKQAALLLRMLAANTENKDDADLIMAIVAFCNLEEAK